MARSNWLLKENATGDVVGISINTEPPDAVAAHTWVDYPGANSSAVGKRLDANNKLHGRPAATGLPLLKNVCRATLLQLREWGKGLDSEGVDKPSALVDKGHNFLAYATQGVYLIAKMTSLSLADRATIIGLIARGASDIDSPAVFYRQGKSLAAPTAALTWVSTITKQRVALADAAAVAGVIPDSVDVISGQWIDGLTA